MTVPDPESAIVGGEGIEQNNKPLKVRVSSERENAIGIFNHFTVSAENMTVWEIFPGKEEKVGWVGLLEKGPLGRCFRRHARRFPAGKGGRQKGGQYFGRSGLYALRHLNFFFFFWNFLFLNGQASTIWLP